MSYQKHTWVTNEIIRSIHLNHIESGIYDEEQRATLAEQELSGHIGTNTSAINTLNGNSSTVGSVDYKIAQALADVGGYKVTLDHTQEVNPSTKYIYLEKDTSATGTDKWQEWIYILEGGVGTWELIDDISLDLSAYVQKTDLTSSSAFGIVKVDGTTITAVGGVISAAAIAPTTLTATLAANQSSVTITGLPTTGNNMIDFFIEGGANYTAIDTSVAGEVTLTYDAISSARAVYCRIEGVS